MADGLFSKIAKAILIGGGTVLSLINPAIGAPLVLAGTAIHPSATNESSDLTSVYGQNLATSLNLVGAYQQTTSQALKLSWLDQLKVWILANPLLGIILGIIGVLGLKYIFGKKR